MHLKTSGKRTNTEGSVLRKDVAKHKKKKLSNKKKRKERQILDNEYVHTFAPAAVAVRFSECAVT